MKPPMPQTLRIGPYTWRVYCSKGAWKKRGDNITVGDCSQQGLKLTIKPGLTLDFERATLWHEIMHAAKFSSGYAIDLNNAEESFIQSTDAILVAVLQDNPDLLDYLGIGL